MLRCKSLKIVEIEINGVKLSNTFEILQYIGKQEERISELEAQVEKMKCCANCRFENTPKLLLPCHICVAKNNWQSKEIKENGR